MVWVWMHSHRSRVWAEEPGVVVSSRHHRMAVAAAVDERPVHARHHYPYHLLCWLVVGRADAASQHHRPYSLAGSEEEPGAVSGQWV